MINSQNNVLNQFQFPMGLKGETRHGQVLMFDETTRKFINVDASELEVNRDSGLDSIEYWYTVPSAPQIGFLIPWEAESSQQLLISLNGLKQSQSAYTTQVMGGSTVVTFSEAIPAGIEVEIIGLLVSEPDSIKSAYLTGDGMTTNYVLNWVAPGPESLFIYGFGGVKQNASAYNISVSGVTTTVIFSTPIPNGEVFEVIGITGTYGSGAVENVSGANLGAGGEMVYASTTSAGTTQILNFKTLLAGNGIDITSDQNYITISNEVGALENVGTGTEILNETDLTIKTLIAGNNISITNTANEITIEATDSDTLSGIPADNFATNVLNLGIGYSVFSKPNATPDNTFHAKTFRSGQDIIIVDTGEELIISNTANGDYQKVTSSTYNSAHTDSIVGVSSLSTPVTINLANAIFAGPGKRFVVKDETGLCGIMNTITVFGYGSQVIDGSPSVSLNTPWQTLELYCDGYNWFIIKGA